MTHLQLTRPLLAHPSSAAEARRSMRRIGDELGLSVELKDDAVLMVSELVGNAVKFGGTGRIILSVEGDTAHNEPPLVVVEVTDQGNGAPARETGSLDAETGRGVWIIAKLTAAWGWYPSATVSGKTVWFAVGATSDAGVRSPARLRLARLRAMDAAFDADRKTQADPPES